MNRNNRARKRIPDNPKAKVTVTLSFPWSCAVSSNRRTAFNKGRHKLSLKYRAALKEAGLRALAQYRGPIMEGPVAVWLKVFEPDKRRRDAPNYAKLILDAMQGVVYTDDRQVVDLRVTSAGVDKKNPRIEATIEPIPERTAT